MHVPQVRSVLTLLTVPALLMLGLSAPADAASASPQPVIHGPDAPWVVGILDSRTSSICSGTLISPVVVMTSADCARDQAGYYSIQAEGFFSWYFSIANGADRVTRIDVAPGYRTSSHHKDDVALLELASPVLVDSYPGLASTSATVGEAGTALGFDLRGTTYDTMSYVSGVAASVGTVDPTTDSMTLAPTDSTCGTGFAGGPLAVGTGAAATIIGVASSAGSPCASTYTDASATATWARAVSNAVTPTLAASLTASVGSLSQQVAGTSLQRATAPADTIQTSVSMTAAAAPDTDADVFAQGVSVPRDADWDADSVSFDLQPYDTRLTQLHAGGVTAVKALSCAGSWTAVGATAATMTTSTTSPLTLTSTVSLGSMRAAIADGSGLCGIEVDVTAGDPLLYPTPPTLTRVTSSPGRTRTPVVDVSGMPGTTADLYSNGSCSTAPIVSVAIPSNGTAKVTLPAVPANATSRFSARAVTAHARSACTARPITFTNDTVAPVLSHVRDVVFENEYGRGDVPWALPSASDASGPVPVKCSRPAPTGLANKTIVVTCTATDAAGNVGRTSLRLTARIAKKMGKMTVHGHRLRIKAKGFAPHTSVALVYSGRVVATTRATAAGRVKVAKRRPTGHVLRVSLIGTTTSGVTLVQDYSTRLR